MYYVDRVVESNEYPKLLEVTPTAVYVRENVEEISDEERTFYRYRESKYSKDDFIELVTKKNEEMADELTTMGGAVVELVALVMGGMR